MRGAIVTSVILALAVFAGNRPAAAHDRDYSEHIEKYHEHMSEAYEEFGEGDMRDGYKELRKAQSEYNRAVWSAPCYPTYGPPVYCRETYVVYPRHNGHRVYNYRSRYSW